MDWSKTSIWRYRFHIPEIRKEIGTEDLEESKLADRVIQSNKPEDNTNV